MAKRKRLTPANPGYLEGPSGLETKSMFSRAAPIADVARDASAAAAFDEVADTLARARTEGRMVLALPLSAIGQDHLVRDRVVVDDADMTALVNSIRARGQQTPIEVVDLGEGRFGLISGWRRCQALMQLMAEPEGAKFDHVLALLRQPDQSSDAYIAMVEENEIRVGLSHYERARIVAKATEQRVFETKQAALTGLFGSVSRAKKSKIGSFVTLVTALDGALRFPGAIGERLGLQLAKILETNPALGDSLRADLTGRPAADPAAEQEILRAAVATKPTAKVKPKTKPAGDKIGPGVWMHIARDGAVTLSGAKVTAKLHKDLRSWLVAQG